MPKCLLFDTGIGNMATEPTVFEVSINMLMDITARIARVQAFALIAIAHLFLFFVMALGFWWFQIQPPQFEKWAVDLFQEASLSKFLGILGAIGVSALALMNLYWKACKWAALRIVRAYVSPKL